MNFLWFAAVYAYAEASDNFPHAVARFVSPNLPEVNTSRCLSFETMVYGAHIGNLDILDERNYKIWGLPRSNKNSYILRISESVFQMYGILIHSFSLRLRHEQVHGLGVVQRDASDPVGALRRAGGARRRHAG